MDSRAAEHSRDEIRDALQSEPADLEQGIERSEDGLHGLVHTDSVDRRDNEAAPEWDSLDELQRMQTTVGNRAMRQLRGGVRGQIGEGMPLPAALRAETEARFGADFSEVRVHTDAEATGAVRQMGAGAFTCGEDIFVRTWDSVDGDVRGRAVLAHELTHVLQQRRGLLETSSAAPSIQHEFEAQTYAVTVAHDAVIDAAAAHLPKPSPVIPGAIQCTFPGEPGFERSLVEGERKRIQTDENSPWGRVHQKVKITALALMAAHRARIVELRNSAIGAPSAVDAGAPPSMTAAALMEIRQAAREIADLERTGERLRELRDQLDRDFWDIRHGADPQKVVEKMCDAARTYEPDDPALQRIATEAKDTQPPMSFALHVQNQLWRSRAAQIAENGAEIDRKYHAFPSLSRMDSASIANGGAHVDRELAQQVQEAYVAILHDVDRAFGIIDSGAVHPFDLPAAVRVTMQMLPESEAKALQQALTHHEVTRFWLNMFPNLLAAAVAFVPVVGEIVGWTVFAAGTGSQVEDMICRKILAAASTDLGTSPTGVQGLEAKDYASVLVPVAIAVGARGARVFERVRPVPEKALAPPRLPFTGGFAPEPKPPVIEGAVLPPEPTRASVIEGEFTVLRDEGVSTAKSARRALAVQALQRPAGPERALEATRQTKANVLSATEALAESADRLGYRIAFGEQPTAEIVSALTDESRHMLAVTLYREDGELVSFWISSASGKEAAAAGHTEIGALRLLQEANLLGEGDSVTMQGRLRPCTSNCPEMGFCHRALDAIAKERGIEFMYTTQSLKNEFIDEAFITRIETSGGPTRVLIGPEWREWDSLRYYEAGKGFMAPSSEFSEELGTMVGKSGTPSDVYGTGKALSKTERELLRRFGLLVEEHSPVLLPRDGLEERYQMAAEGMRRPLTEPPNKQGRGTLSTEGVDRCASYLNAIAELASNTEIIVLAAAVPDGDLGAVQIAANPKGSPSQNPIRANVFAFMEDYFPNAGGNRGRAQGAIHAEATAIWKVLERLGAASGNVKRVSLVVRGIETCDWCKATLPKVAEAFGLEAIEVYDLESADPYVPKNYP